MKYDCIDGIISLRCKWILHPENSANNRYDTALCNLMGLITFG